MREPSFKGFVWGVCIGIAMWFALGFALALLPPMTPNTIRLTAKLVAVILLIAGSLGVFLSLVEMGPRVPRRKRRAYR